MSIFVLILFWARHLLQLFSCRHQRQISCGFTALVASAVTLKKGKKKSEYMADWVINSLGGGLCYITCHWGRETNTESRAYIQSCIDSFSLCIRCILWIHDWFAVSHVSCLCLKVQLFLMMIYNVPPWYEIWEELNYFTIYIFIVACV